MTSDPRTAVIVVSNFEYGGAQQQIVEFVNRADPNVLRLHVVSLSNFVPLADNLTIDRARFHVIRKFWKYDISVPLRLSRLLRKVGADIVHGFLYDAEIACRVAGSLARTSVVIGSERNCDYKIKKNQMAFYRLTESMQDYCVANSHAGAAFNSRMLGYPNDHYYVVHNGVNVDRFSPGSGQQAREELGIRADERVVGVFASFKRQKNHELFFRAAAELSEEVPNLRFLFVGDELYEGVHGSREYKESLEVLIDELGIRDACVFAGNRRDVERLYLACDLTVLASRHEGMPNVILESMASGVPVVATNVADNARILRDGEGGLLVETENRSQLRDAIRSLLMDDALRRDLGAAARRRAVERFSAAVMSQKMTEAYLSMVEKCAA